MDELVEPARSAVEMGEEADEVIDADAEEVELTLALMLAFAELLDAAAASWLPPMVLKAVHWEVAPGG